MWQQVCDAEIDALVVSGGCLIARVYVPLDPLLRAAGGHCGYHHQRGCRRIGAESLVGKVDADVTVRSQRERAAARRSRPTGAGQRDRRLHCGVGTHHNRSRTTAAVLRIDVADRHLQGRQRHRFRRPMRRAASAQQRE